MPEYKVILAEPKFPGNIGAVARTMKNFGMKDLILVNPCEVGEEAYQRAMHAKDVLEGALVHETLDEAVEDLDYLVGTTGFDTEKDRKHLRKNLTPKDFAAKMADMEGTVGIMFGREDYGLYNEELERCDAVVTIPSSPEYPILNISHAATIVFYELFNSDTGGGKRAIKKASGFEKDKMLDNFSTFLDAIEYPEHKKKKTTVMFQRILGRAVLSKWEFHTLMGVFSGAVKALERKGK
ncbi:MAG: RNA methyltransferase [Thermoplasmata archaeon]|nr:MAG: RNA methyltransferase [Thermoplasmata archaeon]